MGKINGYGTIETKAAPSISLPNSVIGYGRAIGLGRETVRGSARGASVQSALRFYFGEYFLGIMFICALGLYTLLMPQGMANPIKLVLNMIDKYAKKVLDIGVATIGLILALPIFIIIPILIKLNSRGPVFYTQERIGLNRRKRHRRIYRSEVGRESRLRERRRDNYLGKPFKVIKFRTMVNDAEKKSGPVWATKNDARVTRIGKILRKTRIDEVPQLLNVIKGDMSMVGPRPERPKFVRELVYKVPHYEARLRVKPGVTGLAQVNSGYDTSIESVVDKVGHDINYIENWSIFSDLKILVKTVGVVITGKGAC